MHNLNFSIYQTNLHIREKNIHETFLVKTGSFNDLSNVVYRKYNLHLYLANYKFSGNVFSTEVVEIEEKYTTLYQTIDLTSGMI